MASQTLNRLVKKARGTKNKITKPITIKPIASPFPPAMNKILLLLIFGLPLEEVILITIGTPA
jgi:hypothetical protein